MKMRVSDYIAAYLSAQGVPQVFEVIGGMTTYLVDSLYRHGKVNLISMHHEQAAAFAADSVGRLSGLPGIAMATSGPGATNLLTGIGSSYFDSSPTLFLTGQVNRNELRTRASTRQLGFQETDIVAVASPITKGAWQVQAPEEVPSMLRKAFALAMSGRPGPVLLDLPMDVQRAEIDVDLPEVVTLPLPIPPPPRLVEEALLALAAAERPLILVGGGIHSSRSADLLRILVELVNAPAVHSLLATDALPYSHPLRVGMIGTYGNRWANFAVGRSDFLLVLGSRLDIRQTGADVGAFKGNRLIYHVDCEPGEINNRISGCHGIVSDLRAFLTSAIAHTSERASRVSSQWLKEISELKRAWPDTAELDGLKGINPNDVMHRLAVRSSEASAFALDVGQNQIWAVQSLEPGSGQRVLTSGGMGAMGFALPAAIGAALASPGRPVVAICGDGGFQFSLQELQTVVHHRLPLKILVLDNRSLGMVRQFQESYFDARYPSTRWGYSAPDFVQVARAYGIPGLAIQYEIQVDDALAKMWADPQSPFLLQVSIDESANTYPKMTFGRPITEMEPFLPIGHTQNRAK
ncbi:MAG: thiamine pyrophosphate-binding protein [Chloroflexota bacterium]